MGVDGKHLHLNIPVSELRKLIADRKEIGSFEALCIDLCGGVDTAGRMLNRLFMWWQKSKNADGWVYKSHVDWYNELRIKRSQLPKARAALELAGVEVRRMKGNLSSPRLHYRLNAELFIKALAKLLGSGIEWLKNFCAPFMQSNDAILNNRLPECESIDCLTPAQSSTTVSTANSLSLNKHLNNNQQSADADVDLHPESAAPHVSEDAQEGAAHSEENAHHEADAYPIPLVPACPLPREIARLHEDEGMPEELAWQYIAQYGERRCIAAADYALRNGDTPPGMWRWILDQTNWYMNIPIQQNADDHSQNYSADDLSTEADLQTIIEGETEEASPVVDARRAEEWSRASAQLALQLDRLSFETWLKDAALIGYEDGTYVVGVRNQYAVDLLTYRLNRAIERVLCDVLGADARVRYEVYKPVAARDKTPQLK